MNNKLLIECGDHSYAPWSIVCVHLIDGTSREWKLIEVDDGREVDGDWVCPDCHEKHMAGNDDINFLRPICMHCVRTIRKKWNIHEYNP